MRKELFRRQAIESATDSMFGKPINMTTPGILAISTTLLGVAMVIALYLYFGEFQRTETVGGVLKPKSGQSEIRVSTGGVVTESPVRLGQFVPAGTTLVRIERSHYSRDAEADIQLEEANLTQRIEVLSKRTQLKKDQQSLEQRHIQTKLSRLADQRTQLQTRMALNARARQLTKRRLDRALSNRAKGLNTIDEVDNKKLAYIDQLNEQARLQEELASLSSEETDLNDELESLRSKGLIEINELQELKLQLTDQLNALQAKAVTLVKAPVDGYVSVAPPPPGQLVHPNDLVTIIRSRRNQLEARVFVPTDAIGFIDVGQRVNLRFDAFPYQRFGSGAGHVVAIERSALDAKDLDAPISNSQQRAFYPVTIALDDTLTTTQGVPIRLRPDQTLQADIVLDRLRIHEWLLDPLYRLRGRLETP
ncbi:HlyD family secretion protein [Marinobacter sp. C2H3]|uniref:HlyD family secretion protein n=1 Tax=Marinobacter sp. C2H3 TaxID=3119003 RepID=UPI00300F684C